MDGFFNGIPQGDLMNYCLNNVTYSRNATLKLMKDWNENQDFLSSVEDVYVILGFVGNMSWSCYYGMGQAINIKNLEGFNILKNIQMNLAAIYFDITMLLLAVPGYTETDYIYYVSYYVADLLMRIYFRGDLKPQMCWLEWSKCS